MRYTAAASDSDAPLGCTLKRGARYFAFFVLSLMSRVPECHLEKQNKKGNQNGTVKCAASQTWTARSVSAPSPKSVVAQVNLRDVPDKKRKITKRAKERTRNMER